MSDSYNIFDEYTAYGLRQTFQEKEWPQSYKDWIHDQIAYELLDSWLGSCDHEEYMERARNIVEDMTYGYEDDDGNEMLDFNPKENN